MERESLWKSNFDNPKIKLFSSEFRIASDMIHLLFSVICAEMIVILLLLFRTPVRKFVVMALDRVKRGKGPVVAKTVAATIFAVFLSTVHSIIDVARRESDPGSVNPTDQVLMARHLLDASLMGFILFLGLMLDRLHHYIRELRLLRKAMEAARKQKRSFDDGWAQNRDEMKAMAAEITALKTKAETLVSESDAKSD